MTGQHGNDGSTFLPPEGGAVTLPCEWNGMMQPVAAGRKKRQAALSPAAIEMIAARFRTLGEPLRIRIIQELESGEKTVSQIVDAVGSTQPNVSKHLRLLQEAGVIGRRQEGNLVYCYVSDDSVLRLCDAVCTSLGERLSRDAKVAAELNRGMARRR
jgi:DNA-binding transcriptional ArsR family regulator